MRFAMVFVGLIWFLAIVCATPAVFSYLRYFKVNRHMSFHVSRIIVFIIRVLLQRKSQPIGFDYFLVIIKIFNTKSLVLKFKQKKLALLNQKIINLKNIVEINDISL